VVDRVNEAPTANAPDLAHQLTPSPPGEFEVAEVKLSPPGTNPMGRLQPGGRLENLQNPGCQVPRFLVRRRGSEPSGRCFKVGFIFGSNTYADLMLTGSRLS
jgi:hypothetical protein